MLCLYLFPIVTTASVPKETMPKGQTTSPDRTFQSTFQESTTYLYSTPTKRVESLVTQEAMAGILIVFLSLKFDYHLRFKLLALDIQININIVCKY